MINDINVLNALSSPIRQVEARIEVVRGASPLATWTAKDKLRSLTIERLGETGKFFGFGIVHKLTANIIDTNREVSLDDGAFYGMTPYFIIDGAETFPCPFDMEIDSFTRDENTNEITITAYDGLYKATQHTVAEVLDNTFFTLTDLAN